MKAHELIQMLMHARAGDDVVIQHNEKCYVVDHIDLSLSGPENSDQIYINIKKEN